MEEGFNNNSYDDISFAFNQISKDMMFDSDLEQIKKSLDELAQMLFAEYESFRKAGFSKPDSMGLVSTTLRAAITMQGGKQK